MTGAVAELLRRVTPGRPVSGRVRAVWNGAVLAESDETIVLEGNLYFPSESLNQDHFQPSEQRTVCPWKGLASYYDIEVAGERNRAAAWFYPRPSPPARKIKGRVAFWHGVEIVPG